MEEKAWPPERTAGPLAGDRRCRGHGKNLVPGVFEEWLFFVRRWRSSISLGAARRDREATQRPRSDVWAPKLDVISGMGRRSNRSNGARLERLDRYSGCEVQQNPDLREAFFNAGGCQCGPWGRDETRHFCLPWKHDDWAEAAYAPARSAYAPGKSVYAPGSGIQKLYLIPRG